MNLRLLITSVLIIFSCTTSVAQYLTGLVTRWNDSFAEWDVFTENEEETYELRLRWDDDLSQWDYEVEGYSGTIKLKWRDKPDEWELSGNGEVITMRTIYRGDFGEWRIRNGSQTLTFKSKWGNRADEWLLRDSGNGNFQVFTAYEGDPREWIIVDETSEDVSFSTRIAMMFIAVFHGFPKG